MREIEAKILDIDSDRVQKKLLTLGAKKTFEGVIDTYYFDFQDDLLKISAKTLRLRTENDKAVLTLKENGFNIGVKARDEYKINVSDYSTAKKILQTIGLNAYDELKKTRTSYQLEKTHFEFDKYLGEYSYIPVFLEIEAESQAKVYEYANLLGFEEEDCKPWAFTELRKHYDKDNR